MAYATLAELIARFGEQMILRLTDRGEIASSAIDEPTVDRALSDASSEIDGYLAVRYRLPLAATPPLVTDLCLTIAIWKLHVAAPDQKVEIDYREARRTLRDISSGAVRLALDGVEPTAPGGPGVRMTDRERPLTEQNLKGFI